MELTDKQVAAIKGYQAAVLGNRAAGQTKIAFPDSAIAADLKVKQEDVLHSAKQILFASLMPL